MMRTAIAAMCVVVVAGIGVVRAESRVPTNAKVYIEPTENGMHTALAGAFSKKKVPVVLVNSAEKADYVIQVVGEHKRAGWAKIALQGDARGSASASMSVTHRESGEIVYAYNVDKGSANRGMQSAAESCAKHFKNHIDGKK